MKVTCNQTKIMRNAWYLKRVQPSQGFGACLRKAWRNEKLAMVSARAEGSTAAATETRAYCPELLQVPADFYGVRGQYYGD